MKIIKVINNNNVCVKDDKGKELIVSGKGLGYNKKCGDRVDPSQVQKTYMIADSALRKKLVDLLSEIPYGYIKFTDDIVEHIKQCIPSRLNESLLVTLSDHICFAIKRKKQGVEFTNPLMESIRECFPEELNLGYYCLEQIEQRLHVSLNPDEAGFIAMHIINARLDTKMSDVYDITKLINGCAEIAERRLENIDRQSAAYERFMVHLKFLSQRLFKNQPLPEILGKDREFTAAVRKSFARQYECAKEIQEYILQTYSKSIGEDELITLAVHLAKISYKS